MSGPARIPRFDAGANPGASARRALVDVIAIAGGVPPGSDLDFVGGYPERNFGCIGIADRNLIAAGRMISDRDRRFAGASGRIDQGYAAATEEQI